MQQFESFAQMQRDAAMRVMEMQRRAQAAMGAGRPGRASRLTGAFSGDEKGVGNEYE